jgi:hypothetical protein
MLFDDDDPLGELEMGELPPLSVRSLKNKNAS